jgi:hypothetical protein
MNSGETGEALVGDADPAAIRAEIERDGLSIVKGLLPPAVVRRMRDAWLGIYAGEVSDAPVIWGPFYGEQNRVHFHRSETCVMYRSYDFLWNAPIDELTREVAIGLNRLRTDVAETDHVAGETMQSDRYGIYVTTSLYPPGDGWLQEHEDHADGRRHWHYMVLLTEKGTDYTDGGLYVHGRSGEKIDVDSLAMPGDVIFFDGTCRHGVDPIGGGAGLGRLQMFSIPVFLETPQQNDRMLEDISIKRFVKAKLRPLKRRLLGGGQSSGGAY